VHPGVDPRPESGWTLKGGGGVGGRGGGMRRDPLGAYRAPLKPLPEPREEHTGKHELQSTLPSAPESPTLPPPGPLPPRGQRGG